MQLDIKILEDIVHEYNKIKKRFPNVTLNFGNSNFSIDYKLTKEKWYESQLVDKMWSRISVQSASGHCGNGSVYAVSVFEYDNLKVFGTKITVGGYDNNHSGWRFNEKSEKDIISFFGEDALKVIKSEFDKNPYEYIEDDDDWDDDDDDDDEDDY